MLSDVSRIAPILSARPVGDAGAEAVGRTPVRRLDGVGAASGPDAAVRRDLAAALVSLGVTVDEGNLLAAQALVRFGVAVTAENLSDVRRGLATHAARRAETIALAKSLNLPLSPAI